MDAAWVGGIFGLLGVGLGLAGPWLIEERKQKGEGKKRRAEKLEELVAAIYEHKHWLEIVRKSRLFGGAEEVMSPFAKVMAIATVHFPTLLPKLEELETEVDGYELWMLEAGQKRIATGEVDMEGHRNAFRPYIKKLHEVMKDIKAYSKAELQ